MLGLVFPMTKDPVQLENGWRWTVELCWNELRHGNDVAFVTEGDPNLTQTVILTRAEGRTPVPEREQLRRLAEHHCTVALFLSASLAGHVAGEFLAAGWSPDTPVAVVKRATWPDQQILRTTVERLEGDLREAGITMHAMILAGRALDPELVDQGAHRSKLYDKAFTHGFREGTGQHG
ncbi:Cobalt-precorrin-4 C(11)-methyltransferase [compost metagenome]